MYIHIYILYNPQPQTAAVFTKGDVATLGPLLDVLTNCVSRVNINTQCQRSPDNFPFSGTPYTRHPLSHPLTPSQSPSHTLSVTLSHPLTPSESPSESPSHTLSITPSHPLNLTPSQSYLTQSIN